MAVVNESAARLIWPHEDAIGQRLLLDIVPEEQPREVIGVVADIPVQRTQEGAQPMVYTSFLQQPSRFRAPWAGMLGQMNFVVRHAGVPLDVVPAVRRAIAEIEPTRPIGTPADSAISRRCFVIGSRTRSRWASLPAWPCCWRRWASTA